MLPKIFGEDLFDEFFNDPFESEFFRGRNPLYGKHAKNIMKTDVRENADSYELDIDLPGFKKEQIKASVQNGYLTVQASKDAQVDQSDKKGRYIRKERCSGSCSRSFYVGEGVNQEDVIATFDDGILNVWVPKKEATKSLSSSYIDIQ